MADLAEPTFDNLSNPLLRYIGATRPAFLSVTFVGCLLGYATTVYGGHRLNLLTAIITMILALVAHAAANVLNDYYDALNGSDAHNAERVYPFTGGSRFIQNNVLTPSSTGLFGYALMGVVVLAGLWLTAVSGSGLLIIGAAGLLIGWAYSAPPFSLMSRGLGEFAITGGWLLVVVGSDYVQCRTFSFTPVAVGLSYALLVANVLYMNQFPDVKADAFAGKKTLVVRLGVSRARWGYVSIAALAYFWAILNVWQRTLPVSALSALVATGASTAAAWRLWRYAGDPAALEPAIKLTILAAVVYGLILAVVLAVA